MLLAGDIGGTKTKLAVYTQERGIRFPYLEQTFVSKNFSGLESMIRTFLKGTNLQVETACFGVAGPIIDGVCKLTNLPWCLSEKELTQNLNFTSVTLLNDLAAVAHAIPSLAADEVIIVNKGKKIAKAPIAVIAPGTGLGEAFLTWNGHSYESHPSEGGHVEFGPRNKIECQLLEYLMQSYEHVSYETVCSGIGIPNIFKFLTEINYAPIEDILASQLENANDITPIVVTAALSQDKQSEICRKTLSLFVSILGAEAGNLALKVMSRGGVYLGGGISLIIKDALKLPEFREAFVEKGRLSSVLKNIPVSIICPKEVALRGAACFGLEKDKNSKVSYFQKSVL